jgi:hypothetical protein
VPADKDEVRMMDVEVQPLTGNDAQRPKWPLSKPRLDIFGTEHGSALLEIPSHVS